MDKYAVYNEFGHNLGVDYVLAESEDSAIKKVKEWFPETLRDVNVFARSFKDILEEKLKNSKESQ